jgi:hypothetical protein
MKRVALWAALILAAASQMTRADTLNLATGVDASNNLLPVGGVMDPHWTSTVDATFDPGGLTQTVYPNNSD